MAFDGQMETTNPYEAPVHGSQLIASPQLGVKQVLFSFTGRIPRRTYWLWYLVTTVTFMMVLGLATAVSSTPAEGGEGMNAFGLILMVVSFIPVMWINLALLAKRWHDRDKSGAWILIYFIPLVGPIWTFIECGCLRGTHGANTYGGDPT
jgi:uncharacterized membrane protein YhaH (DUF805 family)